MIGNAYTDVLVALGLLIGAVVIVALFSPFAFVAWLREEWRLARAESWGDGVYEGNTGTLADPNVAYMATRQRAMAKRMRRQGRALLGPKTNRKAWTPVPHVLEGSQQLPRADNVVPLRVAGGKR